MRQFSLLLRWIAPMLVLASVLTIASTSRPALANHKSHGHAGTLWPPVEDGYLAGEIVSNVQGPMSEWRVGSFTDALDGVTSQSAADWNNALRNAAPTNLIKYPFHCCWTDDVPPPGASATANVRVYGFPHATFVAHCANGDPNTLVRGCVEDDLTPGTCPPDCVSLTNRPLYIIIDTGYITQNVLDHEMGHILYYNEHYIKNPDGTASCNPSYFSVMDALGCDTITPAAHDRQDFYDVYKPQDTPNLTTMDPVSSTQVTYAWNSGGGFRHNIESFYVDRTSDTNTDVLQFNALPAQWYSSIQYSIADEGRFCATARGFSNAGFTGGSPWTSYPYYGCANRRIGPNAGGPFVVTSQREWGGSRIKALNAAGATRYIKVVGPGGENVGCSTPASTANGSTYQCLANVSLRQYANLVWIACTTSTCTAASYGNIDFD